MDDQVLLDTKKAFRKTLKQLTNEDINNQPSAVIIRMLGSSVLKSLNPSTISNSFENCGWFDSVFKPERFEKYGRSAVTTAAAPLTPCERTKRLGEYLADTIVKSAQATEHQQRKKMIHDLKSKIR